MWMISRGSYARVLTVIGGSVAGSLLVACKDLTGSGQLPAGTPNPSIYSSVSGAVGLRNAAIYGLGVTLPNYIVESGLLTDELEDKEAGASGGTLLQQGGVVVDPIDERILPYGTSISADVAYGELQQFRGTASLAMHALVAYDTAPADTAQQHVWNAELHAYVGYVEILLADLYCSGVPLSTLDFQGDYTYQPGSTTVQLYHTALAEEDSALTLGGTTDSVMNLIRVLQGRAYLALGQYAVAKDDVSTVPTAFQSTIVLQLSTNGIGNWLNDVGTVGNVEGRNGLSYHTSGDPRSADSVVCAPTGGFLYSPNYCPVDTLTYPQKYQAALGGGTIAFPVATGVEARLIESEAELQVGDAAWLTTLNTLRTTGTVVRTYTRRCQNGIETDGVVTQAGSPCPAGVVDTTWSAGTGIGLIPSWVQADTAPVCPAAEAPGVPCPDTTWYKGLRPLSDPGTPAARVALLFHERAYWLFLTGHREGDLRRLLRQYGPQPQYPAFASQTNVYPSGVYTAPGTGFYGDNVNLPVPPTETSNPDFHGCIDRNP